MPTFDLHLHLEGAHPIDALIEVGRRHGVPGFENRPAVRATCVASQDQLLSAPTDADRRTVFNGALDATRRVYVNPPAVRELTALTCAALAAQAPDGFELRFSLFSLLKSHLKAAGDPARTVSTLPVDQLLAVGRELLTAVIAGAGRAPARLRFGLSRNLDPAVQEKYDAVARLALELPFRDSLYGLDVLGFAKTGYPEPWPRPVLELVEELRRALPDLVLHAGECWDGDPAQPQQSIRAALELRPDAVGHGVWAASDPALLRACAASGATFEVCPLSNRLLNKAGMLALQRSCGVHPLVRLLEAGVPCVLGSDDPALFGTSLGQDRKFAEALGIRLAELDAQAERRWARMRPPVASGPAPAPPAP